MNIKLSMVDSNRFGIVVARATEVTRDTIGEMMDFCKTNDVDMIIARCGLAEIRTVQQMEKLGFFLCDSQVYFRHNLENIPERKKLHGIVIRPSVEKDAKFIYSMAVESFRGYYGHYHQDERLKPELIEEGYGEWSHNVALLPKGRNETFVADDNGKIAGAICFRLNTDEEGEVVVGSILPEYQKLGIYTDIFITGLEWHKRMGCKYQLTSTQNLNIAVQKVWCRLGYMPMLEKAYYTLHKWFNEVNINELHRNL